MHGACLVSVMPSWTPHASVSPRPTLFYIFYKCAKLCGFCQEWWSSVAGTSTGQVRSTVALGLLCHSLHRGSRQVLPSCATQRAGERGCSTFIVSQHLWFPRAPAPAHDKDTSLPSCPRAPAWPGSVLLATCRGMTPRGAGERMGTTFLPWQSLSTHTGAGPAPSASPFLGLSGGVGEWEWGRSGARHLKGTQKFEWKAGHLLYERGKK